MHSEKESKILVNTLCWVSTTAASVITLYKEYRYEDVSLTTFESIVEELGGGNIAVKGRFHAKLIPYDQVSEAEVEYCRIC